MSDLALREISCLTPSVYPILEFRDNVVRTISATIAKIPGLEKLVETISEKITVFIMSLLAPFVRYVYNKALAPPNTC